MDTEMDMDMEKKTEEQSKRYHKVEPQVDDEAAKKRRIELDADERRRVAEGEAQVDEEAQVDVSNFNVLLDELQADYYAGQAEKYRDRWYSRTKAPFGSFEHETTICAKRFTDERAPCGGHMRSTLQIYSIDVSGLRGDLQFPLNVYGMVAVRDELDHKRNILFHRKRDNCQTLTQQNASLVLTGPTRAVMARGTVVFEVELKVRNNIESEDKVISFLASRISSTAVAVDSRLFKRFFKSKLSTLEFTLGHIFYSVEATISVKVIEGPWRHDSHGQFAAYTTSIADEVVLLDFGDEKVSLDGGNISLSRSVVSVELDERLVVFVRTSDKAKDKYIVSLTELTPLEMGRSRGELNASFCKMEVIVAWSLFVDDVNMDFCCNRARILTIPP